ncbi:MAG: hypothetical protein ACREQJ_16690 [Candidatus Binatia bacterium]
MSDAVLDEFRVGHCRECGRETLAIPELDDDVWRCAHCDERLARIRWIDGAGLALLGYEITNGEVRSSGCTSCVSGGCGIPAATASVAPKDVVAGDRSRIPGRGNG